MTRYAPLSAFTTAFAAEYRGWAAAHAITQDALADALGRNRSYVSERMSGKRALDTEDVDALAALTATTGKELMIELARRVRVSTTEQPAATVTDISTARNTQPSAPFEVDELRGVAYDQTEGEVGDVEEP